MKVMYTIIATLFMTHSSLAAEIPEVSTMATIDSKLSSSIGLARFCEQSYAPYSDGADGVINRSTGQRKVIFSTGTNMEATSQGDLRQWEECRVCPSSDIGY